VRITVLTYVEESERSTEYDVVVRQVVRALRRQGHQVAILGVHADVKRVLAGLQRRRPDLVFNLVEMFAENIFGDIAMEGLLDLLGRRAGVGDGDRDDGQLEAGEDLLLDGGQRDQAAHQDHRHRDVGGDVVPGKPGDRALHGALR